jgi:hypothetical protein
MRNQMLADEKKKQKQAKLGVEGAGAPADKGKGKAAAAPVAAEVEAEVAAGEEMPAASGAPAGGGSRWRLLARARPPACARAPRALPRSPACVRAPGPVPSSRGPPLNRRLCAPRGAGAAKVGGKRAAGGAGRAAGKKAKA